MKNFGLSHLRLVAPRCDPLGRPARALARSASDLLEEAEHFISLAAAVADSGTIFATTPDRPHRSDGLVPLRQAASKIVEAATPPATAAVVFGREANGLTQEELDLATYHVRIPSGDEYPVLNLAQSVLVTAYEIFSALGPPAPAGKRHPSPPAARVQVDQVLDHLDRTLWKLRYQVDRRHLLRADLDEVLTRLPWTADQLSVLHSMLHAADVFLVKKKWERPLPPDPPSGSDEPS